MTQPTMGLRKPQGADNAGQGAWISSPPAKRSESSGVIKSISCVSPRASPVVSRHAQSVARRRREPIAGSELQIFNL